MQTALYTIGQVAKLCDIAIQTLRFYDKIGLIHPEAVHPQNGYRLYSNADVMRIKVVQDLRTLEFSLEEIHGVIQTNGLDDVLQRLQRKREEAEEQLQRIETVIASLERRIEGIAEQQALRQRFQHVDIYLELKQLPDRFVTFIRKRSACGLEPFILRYTELYQQIQEHHLDVNGYSMTIYHEDLLEFDRTDSDIEVCLPVAEAGRFSDCTRTILGGLYITASYHGVGDEDACKRAYLGIVHWMHANGYEECGPAIEQYLVDMTRMMNPDDFIIELQVMVRRP